MTPRILLTSLVASAAIILGALLLVFSSQRDDAVVVFAASSLGGWLDSLETQEPADRPQATWSFAGSDALVRQLVDGAKADVLITANLEVAAPFTEQTKVARSRDPLATNQLVLAVPAGNPAGISARSDLANPDLTIAVCASTVPCGQGFEHIDISADSFEPSARSVLTKLELNEIDAGLVFVTDADSSDLVEVLPVALDIDPSTYWVFTFSDDVQSIAFRDWLLTDGAATLFDNGFGTP